MEYGSDFEIFRKHKGTFWTKNKISDSLVGMVEQMVEGGMLEKNEEGQFRWNKSFTVVGKVGPLV